jgi:hypothetical protein
VTKISKWSWLTATVLLSALGVYVWINALRVCVFDFSPESLMRRQVSLMGRVMTSIRLSDLEPREKCLSMLEEFQADWPRSWPPIIYTETVDGGFVIGCIGLDGIEGTDDDVFEVRSAIPSKRLAEYTPLSAAERQSLMSISDLLDQRCRLVVNPRFDALDFASFKGADASLRQLASDLVLLTSEEAGSGGQYLTLSLLLRVNQTEVSAVAAGVYLQTEQDTRSGWTTSGGGNVEWSGELIEGELRVKGKFGGAFLLEDLGIKYIPWDNVRFKAVLPMKNSGTSSISGRVVEFPSGKPVAGARCFGILESFRADDSRPDRPKHFSYSHVYLPEDRAFVLSNAQGEFQLSIEQREGSAYALVQAHEMFWVASAWAENGSVGDIIVPGIVSVNGEVWLGNERTRNAVVVGQVDTRATQEQWPGSRYSFLARPSFVPEGKFVSQMPALPSKFEIKIGGSEFRTDQAVSLRQDGQSVRILLPTTQAVSLELVHAVTGAPLAGAQAMRYPWDPSAQNHDLSKSPRWLTVDETRGISFLSQSDLQAGVESVLQWPAEPAGKWRYVVFIPGFLPQAIDLDLNEPLAKSKQLVRLQPGCDLTLRFEEPLDGYVDSIQLFPDPDPDPDPDPSLDTGADSVTSPPKAEISALQLLAQADSVANPFFDQWTPLRYLQPAAADQSVFQFSGVIPGHYFVRGRLSEEYGGRILVDLGQLMVPDQESVKVVIK